MKVEKDWRGAEVEWLSVAPHVCEHVQLGSRLDRQRQIRPDPLEVLQHLEKVSGENESEEETKSRLRWETGQSFALHKIRN